MTASDITLVIISGLGVVHGLFLAIFLWFYNEGSRKSNRLLSLLLLVLSFRIGKSVFLEFTPDLDIKIIFIGLASLMAVGPLFYLFTQSCLDKSFSTKKNHLFHFIPMILGLVFGFWINDQWVEQIPIAFFITIFIIYYGHYLTYLSLSYSSIQKGKNSESQSNTYHLLQLLLFSLLAIWIVYVLNLFDEIIPYIVGPVLYTSIAYVVSFIIIQKGYLKSIHNTKYKSNPVSDQQAEDLFTKVIEIVKEKEEYKNANLTLKSLSQDLKVSPQVLSLVINKQSNANFNQFVNRHRIEESIRLLQSKKHQHYTISSIAYEVGFNSISSFNTAFKKQTGKTPQQYRQELIK